MVAAVAVVIAIDRTTYDYDDGDDDNDDYDDDHELQVTRSMVHVPISWVVISLSAAYMRQWNESALVQIMACRLIGAKPLP